MTSGIKRKPNEMNVLKKRIIGYITESVGGTFASACKAANVGRTTGHEWLKADQQFNNAVKAARSIADANGGDMAESMLMAAISKGNLTAAIFYLKTKHKSRGYVEKSIVINEPPEKRPRNVKSNTIEDAQARLDEIMTHQGIKGDGARMVNEWQLDYLVEYDRRAEIALRMDEDIDYRDAYMDVYRLDPMRWINDWGITYNPRNTPPIPKILPFILFPRQREFIQFIMECLHDKESGLIEKSRDIGATWLCCSLSIWLWLFVPGAGIGWGSRKQDLVDRIGDPDSIFEKMRMIIDRLPVWMLPPGFDRREHLSSMKILNKDTNAVIAGESGDQIGRGGRKMIYFKDEAAHYERPELIEAALGDNTDVQIDISSVNGTNNVFYRRRHAGEIWMPGCKIPKGKVRVFIFDWRDHPGKTQEWYDLRRAKAEAEGLLHLLAQEVDRDYTASLDRVIIPAAWIRSAIDAHIKLKFGDDGGVIAGLDVADSGGDANALAIRKGIILQYADHWRKGDTGDTTRRTVQECKQWGVRELGYDSIGIGAGVKAESNRLRDAGQLPPYLKIYPWCAAAAVINGEDNIIPGDGQSPTNEDFFSNLKAQAWWSLRQRFERTHKAITQGITSYPSEQLISLPSTLPRLHEMIAELSGATQEYNSKGKVVVSKTPDGGRSPNLADSIVICYFPVREITGFDVIDCN